MRSAYPPYGLNASSMKKLIPFLMICQATQEACYPFQGLRYVALVLFLVSTCLLSDDADAAEPARPVRIGVLNASWGQTPGVLGLRVGLQELGYQEDTDFVLGVRFTQGDLSALPDAARTLVQHGVDLIFVTQESPAKAAQQATSRIPIVFASVGNPVGVGLIDSFARPGGNTTGVTDLYIELAPKRLELFHAIIPTLKRVLYPYDAVDVQSVAMARVYREAAQRLGIELVEQTVRTEAEAQASLAQIRPGEINGILVPNSASLNIRNYSEGITI